MATWILLDAGLLGLASVDQQNPTAAAFDRWVGRKQLGADVCVNPLTLYEARRDLVRAGSTRKLARLDQSCRALTPLPITDRAWEAATDDRATVRRRGRSTAAPDADAILAGIAATCGQAGDRVIVATTNLRHLGWSPGVDARPWQDF